MGSVWAHVNDNSCFDYERRRSEKRKVEARPGGSRSSKGWFAGEIDGTLCFVAIVLLLVQMASWISLELKPQHCGSEYTSCGIWPLWWDNLAATAHINGYNFKPDSTVLMIAIMKHLIIQPRKKMLNCKNFFFYDFRRTIIMSLLICGCHKVSTKPKRYFLIRLQSYWESNKPKLCSQVAVITELQGQFLF